MYGQPRSDRENAEGELKGSAMKKKNNLGIPDSAIDMIAREILTFTRNYLATEEGRKDFEA